MSNALLIIAGLIVAVFAALAAVPHLVDWNGYRGVFDCGFRYDHRDGRFKLLELGVYVIGFADGSVQFLELTALSGIGSV